MKLDSSCQRYSKELEINGLSFFTGSGRILEGAYSREWAHQKHPLNARGGLIRKGGGLNRIITVAKIGALPKACTR